jgi:transcriptional regulator
MDKQHLATHSSSVRWGMRGTIYIPERHAEKDRGLILDFVEEFSFAMLVTGVPHVQITNLPTVLDRTGEGKIWFHLAKANPQNQSLDGEAVLVFHGPHGYISPNWYQTASAVPTWNFATVHVTGKPRRIEDDAVVAEGLKKLVAKNESRYAGGAKRWRLDAMPDSYLKGMRQGIVAYEMPIAGIEAKFKLGQERIAADREGVVAGIASSPKERGLLDLTRSYYQQR